MEAEPIYIDVAMLGLLGRHPFVVHQLHGAASQHVAVVDLHALPDAPPPCCASPGWWRWGHPDEGTREILSLSGYTLDGTLGLLGQLGDGSTVLASWRPRWTGEDLDEGAHWDLSPSSSMRATSHRMLAGRAGGRALRRHLQPALGGRELTAPERRGTSMRCP